jgi:hypothetical protein
VKNYTDVLIRIRGAKQDDPSLFPVEAQIDGSGSWRGESPFDFSKLDPGKQTKEEYGAALGKQLLNASVARALEQAGVGQGKPVRVRLLVDEEVSAPHWIRWERMFLRVGGANWQVSISPEIPFSRYIPDERQDLDPPADNAFRLLFAVANPRDLGEAQRIDVAAEVSGLLDEFERAVPTTRFRIVIMPGKSGLPDEVKERLKRANWGLAEEATSLDNVSEWLHRDGGYHGLHIICHGNFNPAAGSGVLFLEDAGGATAKAKDYELQAWIHPKLQLMVFQACKSGALVPEGEPPFVGIAPKMVRSGVPAVVAMQDFILMTDARAFSAAFYRALLRDGYVDVAVNEGRMAIPNSVERVDSTIPALFMRLKGGRLWRPDPVRQEVWDTREHLTELPKPLPLRVVQHVRGLDFDPSLGPDGPLYDANDRINELVDTNWLTCITGPAGFDRAALLHLQYKRLADKYLDAGDPEAPFLLAWSELADWGRFRSGSTPGDVRGNMQAIAGRRAPPPELAGRRFVFLIESDRDLTEQSDTQAVETMLQLLKSFPGSRAVLVYDEASLDVLKEKLASGDQDNGSIGAVALLVVQRMEWPDLKRFLIADNEAALAQAIEDRHLSDIANAPWILSRLRDFAEVGRYPVNRADALGLIASSYLVTFDTRSAPRGCAEQALEKIAWRLQWDRMRSMDSDTLLSILAEVRDRRDFRLGDLREGLVRCQILAPSGEEAIRFGYRALQSYFAARYIQKSPRKLDLLEDITATLGRYSRVRHWEQVLIGLAGLQQTLDDRVRLLQTIVAGSTLAEGEQVFLAVRMFIEMVGRKDPRTDRITAEFDPALMNDKVVRQILDTLVWRSRPDIPRPYADRKQAIDRLGQMRHPDAIRHLVGISVDRFPTGDGGAMQFDNSGMRMVAANGLLLQLDTTLAYVEQERPELHVLVDGCKGLLKGEMQPMLEILNSGDEAFSPVAAFALAVLGMEAAGPPLLECFWKLLASADASDHNEMLWAVTEVFSRQEARWLYDQVIGPWMKASPAPDRRLCYLIQKYGQAPEGSGIREYLERAMRQGDPKAQDRALRAYSKLNDADAKQWLVELCYQIVRGDWDALIRSEHIGFQKKLEGHDAWRMQQAALEVLRDVGSEEAIEVIRDSRLKMDSVLFQLSFQVGEQIYWRLSGGLAQESYGAAMSHSA